MALASLVMRVRETSSRPSVLMRFIAWLIIPGLLDKAITKQINMAFSLGKMALVTLLYEIEERPFAEISGFDD